MLFCAKRLLFVYVLLSLLTPSLAQAPAEAQEADDKPFKRAQFNSAPLEVVLSEYSDLTGLTVLVAPGLNAQVTFRSQGVLTKREYLSGIESILAMNNVTIVRTSAKFAKAVPSGDARSYAMETLLLPPEQRGADSDEMRSEVLTVKHMEVAELTKVIDALKSKNARIHALERINGVLLTDLAANINRIREVLDHVDQPIETKEQFFILPIRHVKPSEIKAKLEEVISDLRDKAPSVPTIARPAPSGPPGVIRARPGSPVTTETAAETDVERGMIRGKVKMVADDRTGLLIVITLQSNMKFFEDVVKAFDVTTAPDVLVKVYRLEFADADTIAGMLNTLVGAQKKETAKTPAAKAAGDDKAAKGVELQEYVEAQPVATDGRKSKIGELSAENIKILPDKRTNALIIMASKSDLDTLEEIIRDMDMMLSQVLIEAAIIEVTLSDNLQSGVDWLQKSMTAYQKNARGGREPLFSVAGGGGGGLVSPRSAVIEPGFVPLKDGGGGLTAYLSHYGLNMDVVVRLASSDGRTRVVSTPVILTTDNTDATLTSKKEFLITGPATLDNLGRQITGLITKQAGLELTVRPHINTNKVVMMEIKQSLGTPGPSAVAGDLVSDTTTLNASIAVPDRGTIVLGGLVSANTSTTRTKIPILGDIPLLGRLFNSTTDTGRRTEMIVLISPYVLDTPNGIEAETLRRRRAVSLEDMWKRGPGEWSNSRIAEPTGEQKRIERKQAREKEKAAKADAQRMKKEEARKAKEETARKKQEDAERLKAQEEDELLKARIDAQMEKADVDGTTRAEPQLSEADSKVAPGQTAAPAGETSAAPAVDPAIQKLIARQQARWSNALLKVDRAASQQKP